MYAVVYAPTHCSCLRMQACVDFLAGLYLNMTPRPAADFTFKGSWVQFVEICMNRLTAAADVVPAMRLLGVLLGFLRALHKRDVARSRTGAGM